MLTLSTFKAKMEKYFHITVCPEPLTVSLPHSSLVLHSQLPGRIRMKQSLHLAKPHSTSAASPGYQTTAAHQGKVCWPTNPWSFQFKMDKSYHVCQFMSNDGDCGFFIPVRRGLRIIEEVGFSIGDQSPVLHRPKIKVWQSDLVCESEFRTTFGICLCLRDEFSELHHEEHSPDFLRGYEML